ncbi:type VI secretion system lipoprotein TssJ [Enterobacter asburiae]|uniref:type VI secretion system lipoprotein TssJ n=1 Tax=Enterobacter asburiae TaxID=61645 RepID=UPI003F5730F3
MSKRRLLPFMLLIPLLLSGCGLSQRAHNGTGSMLHDIFYPKVETLHLQLAARMALNSNDAQMSSPVDVRLWPLRNTAAFRQAGYDGLLKQDTALLAGDLSGQAVTVRVRPGVTVPVDIPLADDVQAVAIAAFFFLPDLQGDTWRLTLARDGMEADKPVVIELNERTLQVRSRD